jgi:integrase
VPTVWKNSVSRPTSRKHVFSVGKDGVEVLVRLRTGKSVKCSMTDAGRVSIPSECYYGTIRKPDGTSYVAKLATDRTASATMLADMQRKEDRIHTGHEQPESESKEDLPGLVERFHRERVAEGLSPAHLLSTRRFLSEAFKALELETLADVRRLTSGKISDWILGLSLAPHTKRHLSSGLRSFLRWLKDQRLLNEVARFPRIQGETVQKRRVFTRDEVDRLEKAAPWPRGLLYALAYATIARQGALLSLVAGDLYLNDPKGPTISLRPETAKTGQGQRVPIPKRLVAPLRKLAKERPNGPLFHGIAVQFKGDYAFDKDLKKAKIPKKTTEGVAVFHGLRHSGTTAMVVAGISLEVIRKMGGWKSLEMLARHYAHVQPTDARAAIAACFE